MRSIRGEHLQSQSDAAAETERAGGGGGLMLLKLAFDGTAKYAHYEGGIRLS